MNKKTYRGILADLDGTVNRGATIIPGAEATYRELAERGLKWVFVSNAATRMASDIARKINSLGIPVSDDQVINSAAALLRALEKDYRGARLFVIGEPRLVEGIEAAGLTVTEDPEAVDLVIVAMDTGFTYEKLKRAHRAIQNGALFWATNLDATFPSADGFLPGAGSVVASVATVAGRPPDRVFGKPSPDMAFLALELLELDVESCLVVGDRMETDILFARNAGMDAALVLTGATSRDRLGEYEYAPDYIFDSISGIRSLFE
jgi:HAD superfamily hydrolase (TIGR01457 family)